MTALVITLTSVFGWFLGWFLTARYRITVWHRRGTGAICDRTKELRTRRFNRPHDRPMIAFYALLLSFPWPIVLPFMIISQHLFRGIDKREEAARVAEKKRQDEVATWRAVLKDRDASEIERRVAREVLRGLGVNP